MSNDRTEAAILLLASAVRDLQDAVRLIDQAVMPQGETLLTMSDTQRKLAECGIAIERAVNLLEGP